MHWIVNSFRKYADFNARATRREFWSLAALFAALLIGANYLDAADGKRTIVAAGMGMLELSVSLLLLLPFVSCGVRRLHDSNRSGWWLLLMYIPYLGWVATRDNAQAQLVASGAVLVGYVAVTVLMLLPGDTGENRFGPDPRETHQNP